MVAGNWKMFKTVEELPAFFEDLSGYLEGQPQDRELLFAVPFPLIPKALELCNRLNIRIAAQNCHFESEGAYTGEVSIPMLQELGVKSTLVGHSERRQFFAETDDSVAKKVAACQKVGMETIICIGETQEERKLGQTESVLSKQLRAVLGAIQDWSLVALAYEPVWAIGTGLTATDAQAQEAHSFIRGLLSSEVSHEEAGNIRILYGGSVKPANAGGLLVQEDIDGALVGGASLMPMDFAVIAKS